jgi:O-antigen ligase
MAALSCHVIIVFLINFSSVLPVTLPVLLGMAACSWYAPFQALFIFAGLIPLINGLCVTLSPFFIFHNVLFSCLYLPWFIKNVLLHKQHLAPQSPPGLLADLLSTLILFSLVFYLACFPAGLILPALWSPASFDQIHPLHAVNAAVILLQGLFFFRLLEIEGRGKNILPGLTAVVWALTLSVLFFSGIQLLFDVPPWKMVKLFGRRGLFSPFDDINSYGSIIVVLFSVFLFLFLGSTGKRRATNGIVSLLLFLCAFFSLSRITILTSLAILLFACCRYLSRKMIACSLVLLVFLAALLLAYREKLPAYSLPIANYSVKKMVSSSSLDMRFHRWMISLDMIGSAPLAGHGIGTYYRLYPDFSSMGSAPANSRDLFYHGPENAHNYYIQLAADLGVPALLIFMLLLFYVYRAAYSSITAAAYPQPLRVGLVAGISGYLITCLTNHSLLLPAQQFLFWFAAAALLLLCAPAEKTGTMLFSRGIKLFLLLLIAGIAAGYLQHVFLPRHVGSYEYGLYPYQQQGQGTFRWTMKEAGICMVARSDLIKFTILTNRDTTARNSVSLQLFIDDVLLDELNIVEPGLLPLAYCVPGIRNKEIVLRIAVSATCNPYRLGISTDNRDLGVGMSPVEFLQNLPVDGVGFYPQELWHAAAPPGWPSDKPLEFRWMSRQATLPVAKTTRGKNLVLFLAAHHPGITANPVQVTIRGDRGILRSLMLSDSAWKKIELTPEQTVSMRSCTLRVSRTWNPRLEKVSPDMRDLGLMVAIAD